MLSTVFSVLFAVFNVFLASMVVTNNFIKMSLTILVFLILITVIVYTNFIFGDMTYHTSVSLCIAIIYSFIIIPTFGYISAGI